MRFIFMSMVILLLIGCASNMPEIIKATDSEYKAWGNWAESRVKK